MVKAVVFLLIVAAGSSPAQTSEDAESFIRQAAGFARSGRSWKAEGYVDTTGIDGKEQRREQFHIAYRLGPPIAARLEITDGPNRMLRVCDGTSQWTYYPVSKSYVRLMLPQISPCAYPINAWPPLPVTLRSPVLGDSDTVNFGGHLRLCQVIRGAFTPLGGDSRHSVLALCVDTDTKLILRQKLVENQPIDRIESYTFSSIERDASLNADLFRFRPPEGSEEIAVINWLDPMAQPSVSALRVSNEMMAPVLVNFAVPQAPFGTARGPSGGAVGITAEIDGEGNPRHIRVFHSLRPDLDVEAVKSLATWRFQPAFKDGKPVTVVTAVAVKVRVV
jgi:outer membrane lipoprotein-sorting protein